MHDSEHSDTWGQRVTSPTPSVAQFAANFAQRFGSLVSNISAKSPTHLPTDEELEAEAERERETTRREAERILSREAETKRLEERVLAMIDSDMRRSPLQPPPSIPSSSTPPSPASSKDGSSWLAVVKNRLTPTKESLTPAQQIIHETKVRDKEYEKEEKKIAKERKETEKELKKIAKKQSKQRSGEWPSSPEGKFNDPAFIKLGVHSPQQEPLLPRPITGPPSTPPRQRSMPPSLAPSPMRNDAGSSSPARSGPPLYALFNSDGALDIPGTLLTIASRFEKLERWTVGHVRALEERMDDVERWLVEKEKEKDAQSASGVVMAHRTGEPATVDAAISELRDEVAEVQGRIGELGREMAKMVTAPGNLSSGPSRSTMSLARAPSTSSSIAVRSISSSVASAVRNVTPSRPKEPTSPTVTTPPVPSASARTRLPYPTGDYATPPDSVQLSQGAFSPPDSPPSANGAPSRHASISGLPSNSFDFTSAGNSPSGLPSSRPQSPPSLPLPPGQPGLRRASVSPTPRKRYTVALGGPIMAPDRDRDHEFDRPSTPHSRNQSRELGTALYSTSPISVSASLDTDESDTGGNDETIGKAKARSSGLSGKKPAEERDNQPSPSPSPSPTPTQLRRARPQSMYSGPTSISTHNNIFAPAPIAPLNTRLRSRSTDRFGLSLRSAESDSERSVNVPTTPTSAKFVDPLIRRKQTKEAQASTAPPAPRVMPGKPKVPVEQLVRYFDKDKKA